MATAMRLPTREQSTAAAKKMAIGASSTSSQRHGN